MYVVVVIGYGSVLCQVMQFIRTFPLFHSLTDEEITADAEAMRRALEGI